MAQTSKCIAKLKAIGCPVITGPGACPRAAFTITLEGLGECWTEKGTMHDDDIRNHANYVPACNGGTVWGSYYDRMYLNRDMVALVERHGLEIQWRNETILDVFPAWQPSTR